jgi:hypothetical protein
VKIEKKNKRNNVFSLKVNVLFIFNICGDIEIHAAKFAFSFEMFEIKFNFSYQDIRN